MNYLTLLNKNNFVNFCFFIPLRHFPHNYGTFLKVCECKWFWSLNCFIRHRGVDGSSKTPIPTYVINLCPYELQTSQTITLTWLEYSNTLYDQLIFINCAKKEKNIWVLQQDANKKYTVVSNSLWESGFHNVFKFCFWTVDGDVDPKIPLS